MGRVIDVLPNYLGSGLLSQKSEKILELDIAEEKTRVEGKLPRERICEKYEFF